MPERIQLRCTKGWRLHPNTKSVARPGPWGNPFRVGHHLHAEVHLPDGIASQAWACGMPITPQLAVDLFRAWVLTRPAAVAEIREQLAGRDLACWCKLGDPCHADVLLELANDREYCALSQRVDGKRHSWKFDGDDPYVTCHYCGEVRSATSAAILRPANGGES